jgi:hypothetical protein
MEAVQHPLRILDVVPQIPTMPIPQMEAAHPAKSRRECGPVSSIIKLASKLKTNLIQCIAAAHNETLFQFKPQSGCQRFETMGHENRVDQKSFAGKFFLI